MAPGILSDELPVRSADKSTKQSQYPQPLKLSGALEKYKYEDTTPIIGREFFGVNIVDDLLTDDEALRDLAITSMLCSLHTF